MRDVFDGAFADYRAEDWAQEWRAKYREAAERVRDADEATWLRSEFQRFLWEQNPVSSIGPGNSVTVSDAYADHEVASRLLDLRSSLSGVTELTVRGQRLQAAYDDILAMVYPKYTKRRPKARLTRLLALLFPRDMTCLMDGPRVWSIQRLIGAKAVDGDFIAQHASLRHAIDGAVGSASDLAGEVDRSIFAWYLWEAEVKNADGRSIVIDKGPRKAHDLPALALLPAEAQRRSLPYIGGNVDLLVAVVRESEQGIDRDDLATVILSEATQLNASSVGNVISQAQGGLGLIKLENGAYRPTERGLALLAGSPAAALQEPLVGRVFGVGHILRLLADRQDGIVRPALVEHLRSLVPSWKTDRSAAFIVAWVEKTGLIQPDPSLGGRLRLTEEGEAYAEALPEDFERRWKLLDPEDEPFPCPGEGLGVQAASGVTLTGYDATDIVAEGCFFPLAKVEAALTLLRRKKNLILQGPPGTGKTWLAKRLGYALIGAKDPTRLAAVQFQPSLSYEDFVRGWRPDGSGGLKLADGAFLDAIAVAHTEPDRSFVLVIEEVNRGNPAQIFGELLTLLEADKRGREEGLRLAYPRYVDERIHVPPNLHVIGTMNLADRSLALLDLALRRRFAFVDLEPELGPAWREWCASMGSPATFLDGVADRVAGLNDAIASDRALGPQFRIGHSFVTPPRDLKGGAPESWHDWFEVVVETEIAPLLREYWFDDPERATKHVAALRLGPRPV